MASTVPERIVVSDEPRPAFSVSVRRFDRWRTTRRARQLSAEEVATRLDAHRVGRNWMARCPVHDDRTPSLCISEGRDAALLMHCFGCGASFKDLLRAVGGETPPNNVVEEDRYSYSSFLSTSPTTVFGGVSRIGVEAGACPAHPEAHLPGDLVVRLPPRAGFYMRLVLSDLVDEANERIKRGHRMPIAYGSHQVARTQRLDDGSVRRALRSLERHNAIECVGRLPLLVFDGIGAKLYRLVVWPNQDSR